MSNTEQHSAKPAAASRRAMLFGASTAVAGAAALTLTARTPSGDAQAEVAPPKPEKGGGYRVTPHNLHYYATTLV